MVPPVEPEPTPLELLVLLVELVLELFRRLFVVGMF